MIVLVVAEAKVAEGDVEIDLEVPGFDMKANLRDGSSGTYI